MRGCRMRRNRLRLSTQHPILLRKIMLRLFSILCPDYHQCRRFEICDLVRVVSFEQCHVPCAVEFDWGRENRFE